MLVVAGACVLINVFGHIARMEISVSHGDSGAVLTVTGDIDVESGYGVYLAAVKHAEEGNARVVFDLAGVAFVDSVGLGMLIRARDELADHYESTVVLRNISDRFANLLEMTALTGQFVTETR